MCVFYNGDDENDHIIELDDIRDDDALGYDDEYHPSMMEVEVPRCECVCRTSTSES